MKNWRIRKVAESHFCVFFSFLVVLLWLWDTSSVILFRYIQVFWRSCFARVPYDLLPEFKWWTARQTGEVSWFLSHVLCPFRLFSAPLPLAAYFTCNLACRSKGFSKLQLWRVFQIPCHSQKKQTEGEYYWRNVMGKILGLWIFYFYFEIILILFEWNSFKLLYLTIVFSPRVFLMVCCQKRCIFVSVVSKLPEIVLFVSVMWVTLFSWPLICNPPQKCTGVHILKT